MEEIWKDVVGYEGFYEVSNFGSIRRLAIKHRRYCARKHEDPKTLTQWKVNHYPTVSLNNGVKKQLLSVHRIVATAFIPNPNKLPEVNHKDETRDNNHVGNLEWCTRKYNINYGTCIARSVAHKDFKDIAIKSAMTQTHGPVDQYTLDGKHVKTWISTNEPKRLLGYNQGHIWECCNGKRKQAHGYIWQSTPKTIS